MRTQRLRLKLYRYLAGELAPEERARRSFPRLSTNRVLYWKIGRWVYCARVVTRLAGNLIREYDLDPSRAFVDWGRFVPFDPNGYADSTWLQDPDRGMPCVVFPHE